MAGLKKKKRVRDDLSESSRRLSTCRGSSRWSIRASGPACHRSLHRIGSSTVPLSVTQFKCLFWSAIIHAQNCSIKKNISMPYICAQKNIVETSSTISSYFFKDDDLVVITTARWLYEYTIPNIYDRCTQWKHCRTDIYIQVKLLILNSRYDIERRNK